MRKLNKGGFWMGEEAGKFILGVIAVVLLFMLGFKLVGIMRQNTQYEQAKYTMSLIEEAINTIEEGKTKTIFVESPRDWLIWTKISGDKNQELCICPSPSYEFYDFTNIKELMDNECKSKGICKKFNNKLVIPSNCFSVNECTILDPLPTMLTLRKIKGTIGIYNHEIQESTEILSKIFNNQSLMNEIEKHVFSAFGNKKNIETGIKEIIKEYEKEKNIEIENWYLVIIEIPSNTVVQLISGKTSSLIAKDTTLREDACFNKILAKISPIGTAIVKFYSEDNNERLQSPSEKCFGGKWLSIPLKFQRDGKEKNTIIEFRADVKK
jgi:hypothetical protein